jgi:hypothetical protein
MLVALADLHKALSVGVAPEQVVQWLVEISGLSLKGLQNLYARPRDVLSDQFSILAAHGGDDSHLPANSALDAEAGACASKATCAR